MTTIVLVVVDIDDVDDAQVAAVVLDRYARR